VPVLKPRPQLTLTKQKENKTMQSGPTILAFLPFLLVWGGMIAGWVIFLIAVWRGMKAHESVAESLRKIADKDK
jgi:hypothetical protein